MLKNVGDLDNQFHLNQSSPNQQVALNVLQAVNQENAIKIDQQALPLIANNMQMPVRHGSLEIIQSNQLADDQFLNHLPSHVVSESPQNALSDKYGARITLSPQKLLISSPEAGSNVAITYGEEPPPTNVDYPTKDCSSTTVPRSQGLILQPSFGLIDNSSQERLLGKKSGQDGQITKQGEVDGAKQLP